MTFFNEETKQSVTLLELAHSLAAWAEVGVAEFAVSVQSKKKYNGYFRKFRKEPLEQVAVKFLDFFMATAEHFSLIGSTIT